MEPKILSIEINGKQYKLVDIGTSECKDCDIGGTVSDNCPRIRGTLLCCLNDETTKVWKEVKCTK